MYRLLIYIRYKWRGHGKCQNNPTLVNISVKMEEARKMSKKSPLRRITFDVSVANQR